VTPDIVQRFHYELSGGQRAAGRLRPGAGPSARSDPGRRAVSMLKWSIRIGMLNLWQSCGTRRECPPLTSPRHRQRAVCRGPVIVCTRQIDETGPIEDVRTHQAPETQLLMSAVPDPRAPLSVAAETDAARPPGHDTQPPAAGSLAVRWPSENARRSRRSSQSLEPHNDADCQLTRPAPRK